MTSSIVHFNKSLCRSFFSPISFHFADSFLKLYSVNNINLCLLVKLWGFLSDIYTKLPVRSEEEEDDKMSAGTSEFFCLICLLVCSCTAQTVYLGQNASVPCQFISNKHNNITLLKWSRLGLGPDNYILLYEDGRFHPDKQLPSYKDRVYLQDMETRDFSLILMNVTMEDEGSYECLFIEEGRHEFSSIVYLEVVEPGDKDGGNMVGVIGGHLGVVGVMLLHSVVSLVFF